MTIVLNAPDAHELNLVSKSFFVNDFLIDSRNFDFNIDTRKVSELIISIRLKIAYKIRLSWVHIFIKLVIYPLNKINGLLNGVVNDSVLEINV